MATPSQIATKLTSRKLLSIIAAMVALVVFNLALARIDPALLESQNAMLVTVSIAGLGGFNAYRQGKVDEVEAKMPKPIGGFTLDLDDVRVTGKDDILPTAHSLSNFPSDATTPEPDLPDFVPTMRPTEGDPPAGTPAGR